MSSLSEARQSWANEREVSLDTLRTYVTKIRKTRQCLQNLNPSTTVESFFRKIILSYKWETFLLTALRQFEEAFAAHTKALSLLDAPPFENSTVETARRNQAPLLYQNRGYLHYLLGNLSESIQDYLNAYDATPVSNTGERVEHLLNVGILHQRTQDYQSARYYYRRAHRLLEKKSESTVDEYVRRRARVFSLHADLLLEETLNTGFDRAALQRARDWARRGRAAAEIGSEQYGWVSLALSEALGYLGEFEEAYQLNEEVRTHARSNEHVEIQSFALYKLGVLHLQTERWARADSILHQALTMVQNLKKLDHQRRVLLDLGRLYELQKDWSRAETYYRKAVEVVERHRESLTASQWSLTAFGRWQDSHRGLVRALLAQNRPREALVALDRTRARHLQDLRTQARLSNQLPSKMRARFDRLTTALTEVRNRLAREDTLTPQRETTLRNREASLMAARRQVLEMDSTSARPTFEEIAETFAQQDRALVSYFLDDPWPVYDRSPRSVALILAGDTLRTVPLPDLTQDSVQAHVEAISPLFTSRGKPNRANAMHFDLRPLHQLHEAVYAPVAEHLPSDRPLTVIPDGPLFHTPFSMLVRSMPGGRFSPSEARYVLHDRPTSMELASSLVATPSGQSFEWAKFRPQMAAYGVSDFDTLRTVPSSLRSAIPEALDDSSLVLPSLPGVREELRAVESTVPDARVLLNDQATEADFCRSVQKAGVLHVASHAFVNASSPLQNAILLRPDSAAQSSSDGVLFLHELQGQRSRIPMVVLSGCSTASGTLRGGEGMEGLQYAFRAMGAQSTVSTLWPVADQASRTLMDGFYQHLQDGHPKDVALRQAQLDFLDAHPQKASPFFWAPPVLYGSPAALPLDAPLLPSWAWWSIALGGLVLVLLLGWWLWTSNALSLRLSLFS